MAKKKRSKATPKSQPKVRAELVKAIPSLPEGVGMNLETIRMANRVRSLRSGQIVQFKFGSSKEAKYRAESMRRLKRSKKVTFKRVVKRGSELYVEK